MGKFIDLTGQVFGRLTVISRAENKGGRIYWNCKCECGNEKRISRNDLKRGSTKSCGCLNDENRPFIRRSHGMTKSSEHTTWLSIKSRCYNPKNKCYKDYGGRGIIMCEEWLNSFEQFLEDMGPKPIKEGIRYSIERNDVDGNYCKENCRWATDLEQARNKRSNHLITFNGKTQCIAAWSKELFPNDAKRLIYERIKNGWSVDDALKKPSDSNNNLYQSCLIKYNGKSQSLIAWAKELYPNSGDSIVNYRINKGWSIEKALTTPSRTKNKSNMKRNKIATPE